MFTFDKATGLHKKFAEFADNTVWSMNLLSRDKHVMP
jgi:hypothetical protein